MKETPNIKQTDVKYTEDLEGLGQMVGEREIDEKNTRDENSLDTSLIFLDISCYRFNSSGHKIL